MVAWLSYRYIVTCICKRELCTWCPRRECVTTHLPKHRTTGGGNCQPCIYTGRWPLMNGFHGLPWVLRKGDVAYDGLRYNTKSTFCSYSSRTRRQISRRFPVHVCVWWWSWNIQISSSVVATLLNHSQTIISMRAALTTVSRETIETFFVKPQPAKRFIDKASRWCRLRSVVVFEGYESLKCGSDMEHRLQTKEASLDTWL